MGAGKQANLPAARLNETVLRLLIQRRRVNQRSDGGGGYESMETVLAMAGKEGGGKVGVGVIKNKINILVALALYLVTDGG